MSLLTGYSKKLVAFLVYVAVVLLNKKFEIGLAESDVYALTGATGLYTIGQGLSDFGKEREKVAQGK